MQRVIKGLAWTVGGLIAMTVLVYLVALVVNLRDQPPSAAASHMRNLLDDRPAVPDADNAYLYFLGFSAPDGVSPDEAGTSRAAWIDAVNRDPSIRRSPPDIEDETLVGEAFTNLQILRRECGLDSPTGCRDAFERLAKGPGFTTAEIKYLGRYRELLTRKQWRETFPLDPRITMPRYSDVLHVQRLMHLELRRLAKAGAAPAIRTALAADMEFWREMQKSSDYLITKMVANAGLAQHFFLGNLVIRSLPLAEQAASVPEGWSRELSAAELDLHQVLAGELRFSEALMRQVFDGGGIEDEITGDEIGFFSRASAALSRPFFQPQDQANHQATEYMDLARRFQQPLERYPELLAEARQRVGGKFSWSLYNPVGQTLRSVSEGTDMARYALRVGALEGMRRAALVTVTMRAAGIRAEDVAGRLAVAELRNPFDDQPFPWEAAPGAVVYPGLDTAHVRRQVYFY